MTPFKFSLERLLHLKKRLERQAELDQAAARMREYAAAAKLAELEADLLRSAERLTAPGSLGSPSGLEMIARLGDGALAAGRELAEATLARQAADQRRSGVAVEVEALQELRHKQLQTHKLMGRQAERENTAEIALRSRSRMGEGS